ncbi:MAG: hypothetical protein CSA79_01285 [Thiothrix nivea]|nr:MAG: hypothetical protein CSA79_01285 [Thiothrix nivea]
MKSIFLLMVIVPGFLLGSCSTPAPGTPSFAQQCEQGGGRWVRGGIAGFYGCLRPAPDAGKRCTDSSQCAHHCNAVPGTEPPPGTATSGQCQANNNYSGCHIEIRQGIAQPRYCVKI